ncbi:MAG: DUF6455 family protein [Yoonia sp.]|uniref:DUF6455 family protein n=1 Tax=Yoonia sp. TaxID=2212373 RepID=UPI003EF81181
MQTLGNARDHFWRVIKMAKATQVDLSTALDEGVINIDEYADMITGCQGCAQVGKCDRLLEAVDQLDEAPSYCVNHDTFAALRKA